MPENTPSSSGKPSPVLIIFLIFPLVGILAAVGFALAYGSRQNTAPPTPEPIRLQDTTLVNKPAPNFELPSLDGKTVRLSSTRGHVVFLNFWATWCEPCKREMPALQQFAQEQGSDGAMILAINNAETPDVIRQFLADNGVSALTVLLDGEGATAGVYRASRLPTTVVLDPAGVVRYIHLGEMTTADLQAYVDELGSKS